MITSKASRLYIENNEDKLEYTVEYTVPIARRYLNSDYHNVLQKSLGALFHSPLQFWNFH